MPTYTTNLNAPKPIPNSSTDEDLWGEQQNSAFDIFDSEAATATVAKDFADFEVSRANAKDFSEVTVDKGSTINGTLNIDYSAGHYQYGTVDGDITDVVFTNFPASGRVGFLTLELTQDATGGHTITLGAGHTFRTIGGSTIQLTSSANAVDKLRFETRDGGTTVDVFTNQDIKS